MYYVLHIFTIIYSVYISSTDQLVMDTYRYLIVGVINLIVALISRCSKTSDSLSLRIRAT